MNERLARAREARAEARSQAAGAAARLATLRERYLAVEAEAERTAAMIVDVSLEETALQAKLARARSILEDRAAAAYRAGPGMYLSAFLNARSLGDVATGREIIERAILADVREAAGILEARDAVRTLRRKLDRTKARLIEQQQELERLQDEMTQVLAAAEEAVARAGVRVRSLEREQRRLARAREREARRTLLLPPPVDQGDLFSVLGPAGGPGCDIPPDLKRTGESFTGEASFYGQEFAGLPTATGATFHPELFTAAHRTLPLPSFLHVSYGDRCATVLVNDRGPYVDGRVLDLSQGAAEYLGLPGIGVVEAEILERR